MQQMKLMLTQCKREMADSASAFCGPSLLPQSAFSEHFPKFLILIFLILYKLTYCVIEQVPHCGVWHTLLIQFFQNENVDHPFWGVSFGKLNEG